MMPDGKLGPDLTRRKALTTITSVIAAQPVSRSVSAKSETDDERQLLKEDVSHLIKNHGPIKSSYYEGIESIQWEDINGGDDVDFKIEYIFEFSDGYMLSVVCNVITLHEYEIIFLDNTYNIKLDYDELEPSVNRYEIKNKHTTGVYN